MYVEATEIIQQKLCKFNKPSKFTSKEDMTKIIVMLSELIK